MKNNTQSKDNADENSRTPHQIRLPGFIVEEEIGLGDIIKRTTSYLGIHPCRGCERRAEALNRWLVFKR
jgi:hypothetical protein